MAITSYGVNDALAVKLFSRTLAVEALKATEIAPLIGDETDGDESGADSIIVLKRETKKGAGDKITYGLNVLLSGDGVTEGEVQEGNEEALTTYDDSIFINELMHAVRVRSKNAIDSQRVLHNARVLGKNRLKDWWAKRYSVMFFNHVCGAAMTPATSTKYTGLNAVVAPSTNRIFRPNAVAADQSLAAADKFNLTLIDYAKEKARLASPQIRPLANGKYVIYLHDVQITDLRTNTSTGQWLDITKAALQGGKGEASDKIYKGALGEYNGVVIRQSYDITQGVHSTAGTAVSDTRRAVFLGVQAATMAFGRDGGPTDFNWVEETFDYKRQLGISAQGMLGIKKCRFNSEDHGVIVIPTYAAAHA